MLDNILEPAMADLLSRERQVLGELGELLSRVQASQEAQNALRDSLSELEELFLLVIVGEFNAGKSVFVNALLGDELLEQGVTPTTSQIHLLRYGETEAHSTSAEGFRVIEAPVELLREIRLVDTPGTNAIDREHEALTRRFVPRADLVLFVTSADRPFTESERAFLERIREWGKKVVVVLNKVDLLESEAQIDEVQQFIVTNARELLGFEPIVFALSGRSALRFKLGQSSEGDPGFSRLERYVRETLDQGERIHLKLLSPLRVAGKLVRDEASRFAHAQSLLEADLQIIQDLERQLELYSEDLEREFRFRLGDVEKLIYKIENSGVAFFDERLRARRIPELLNKAKVQLDFEREVVVDMPSQIERQVGDIIDWMVESELRQWKGIHTLVERRQHEHGERIVGTVAEFESSRSKLLETLGRAARQAVETYDRSGEADRLAAAVRQAVAGTAVLEAGAVGLGGLVALLASTTAADVTGVLAAGALATLGLFVIPARRQAAKSDLRSRLGELRVQLISGLEEEFTSELESSTRRLLEAVGPYTRFVRAEHRRLEDETRRLEAIESELRSIEDELDRLHRDSSSRRIESKGPKQEPEDEYAGS